MTAADPDDLAAEVALACRILARAGLASASLGHVSARSRPDRIVIRCRGPHDTGLLFTTPDAVQPVDRPADGYRLPHELPIHTEIYRARPEVGAVVHVHAPAAVLCGLAGLELRPVFGAFDIPAARLALAGVPVFPRAALITRPELGAELVAAMAGREVCLMRGHGITAVGPTVQAAVARALNLEQLARVTVELARLGARPDPLTEQDRAELPDLGAAFDDGLVWRHHQHIDSITDQGEQDMGRLDGRVAIITGAARGQGRAHALTLAAEGATVVAWDIADQIDGVPYAMATKPDLEETVRLVTAAGGSCTADRVDVRSRDAVAAAVGRTRDEHGRVDILVNAAGIVHWKGFGELTESDWHDVVEVNLYGSVNAIHSVLPTMVEQNYGRIVCTGSTLGRAGGRNLAGYSASKWALHGLVKCVAIEYAPFGITANIVNPTIVRTPMMDNENAYKLFCPDIEHPTLDDALPRYQTLNQIPVPWVEPEVISRSVLFLVSDDAQYITGAALDVAAGANALYTA